jgi:hypothetical protein
MARGDPVRVRAAVLDDRGAHAGYVTTVGYPDRDISAVAEGTPFFEIAVADLSEAHVALVQRFRRHWLVRCGPAYEPTDTGGELTAAQVRDVAALALSLRAVPPAARAARLCAHLATLLPAGA